MKQNSIAIATVLAATMLTAIFASILSKDKLSKAL
jgi:hypothetical protein